MNIKKDFMGMRQSHRKACDLVERMNILRESWALMMEPRDFEVGDFVTWKSPYLVSALLPSQESPALVVDILSTPIRGGMDRLGSNLFNSPVDTVVLIYDEDGDVLEYHFDSRRLKKAELVGTYSDS